jgi:hypothetical protein
LALGNFPDSFSPSYVRLLTHNAYYKPFSLP